MEEIYIIGLVQNLSLFVFLGLTILPRQAYIRECGSTVHVGLAHITPPTNTNFRTFY